MQHRITNQLGHQMISKSHSFRPGSCLASQHLQMRLRLGALLVSGQLTSKMERSDQSPQREVGSAAQPGLQTANKLSTTLSREEPQTWRFLVEKLSQGKTSSLITYSSPLPPNFCTRQMGRSKDA